MTYTNEQIAANESLWDEYYNVNGDAPYAEQTEDERLADLDADYPEED